jgi:hypothetical protein
MLADHVIGTIILKFYFPFFFYIFESILLIPHDFTENKIFWWFFILFHVFHVFLLLVISFKYFSSLASLRDTRNFQVFIQININYKYSYFRAHYCILFVSFVIQFFICHKSKRIVIIRN